MAVHFSGDRYLLCCPPVLYKLTKARQLKLGGNEPQHGVVVGTKATLRLTLAVEAKRR